MIVVGKQQMTLSGRVGRGTAWVAGGEIAQQAMRLVGAIILARLLNPADYGLAAMAAFVVGLIEVFARCGMTEALIQKKDVTDDDWSSIYWAGVGLGGLVGIMAWFLAPMAALFYRNPSVAPVLQAIAWLALVTSLGATQAAFLAKSMEFRTIALVEWLGFLAGAIVAIAMAWSGWGVWSLVANGLISAAVRSFLFHVRCVWRPSFRFRLSTLRWAVKFGLGLQAFGILNYFNRRLDDVLIGRYVGSVGLGYYSRAYELMLYPVQNIAGVVGRVIFPALSEIGDDLPRLRAGYLRAVLMIATVTFPLMLGLLVTAPEVIPVIYGPQWAPTVPILQVLCVVGLLQSVATTTGWIFMVRGRTDLMFFWAVAVAFVVWPSFLVGLPWGVMGVAVAYGMATGLLFVPCLVIPFRLIELRIGHLIRELGGVLVGALLMMGVVMAVRGFMVAWEIRAPVVLVASVTTGVLTYLAWLLLTSSGALREVRLAWERFAERPC